VSEVRADPIEALRQRTSSKWVSYPADVLPLFVAEMDYPVAPAIAERLADLVSRSDLGYDASRAQLGTAFAEFAERTWGWSLDASTVRTTVNVMAAILEITRSAAGDGGKVLVNTPVYAPFFSVIREVGAEQVDVPLTSDVGGWSLDLDGIEAAYRDGVRVHLLCNPHNPVGLPHARAQLERLAELAAQYDVLIVSDEIHGALTHPGVEFVPFLTVSDAAREVGVTVTSATKAFNVPGATTAWWVPGSPAAEARYAPRLSESLSHKSSQLGTHAAIAALTGARDWLDGVLERIVAQRDLLEELVAARLPGAVAHRATASYLAWIDFRPLGWGDDPQQRIVREARVALSSGLVFGEAGRGFARLNFACSPEVLEEAITRIAALR